MTNHPQAVIIGMMGAGKTRVGRETAQVTSNHVPSPARGFLQRAAQGLTPPGTRLGAQRDNARHVTLSQKEGRNALERGMDGTDGPHEC